MLGTGEFEYASWDVCVTGNPKLPSWEERVNRPVVQ